MRIGVDARPLQDENRFRGIGKYTGSLLAGIADVLAEDGDAASRPSFVCYLEAGQPVPELLTRRFPSARLIRVPRQRISDIRYVRLLSRPKSLVPARRGDIDVLLQCDAWGGIPVSVPTVAVFYDAIPLLFKDRPERLPLGRKWVLQLVHRGMFAARYRRFLAWYRRSAGVVTISESGRRDYLRLIDPAPKHPVRVVLAAPVVTDSARTRPADDGVLDRLGLRGHPYLLYVGGNDPRKNVLQLLRDLRALLPERPDLKLVVVGREFEFEKTLEVLGWTGYLQAHPELAAAVIVSGYVEDEELLALYANAQAFVFPSRYEGFGLPVLEAMDHGCPVVCYDNSSLPEVAGDAALVVPDGTPMAPALSRLLAEPGLREELVAKGRSRVDSFSWKIAARAVLEMLGDAARGD